MPNRDLASIRNQYQRAALEWHNLDTNPLIALQHWINDAIDAKLYEPTAMTVATSDHQQQPHARVVLLKGLDHGLVFYTNYNSPKGHELNENARAACTFFWPELERQIRIEGIVSKTTETESDQYFTSRPRDSQLAACASRQGQIIDSRGALEQDFAQLVADFADKPIPRPENWGGYRLEPQLLEFWQGRPNRLHDRLRFRLQDNNWQRERLSP
jgi:pyridoxamine 5'-phosphate oxidase